MSRYNHKHKLSKKEYIYRILFSVIAITILVVLMPYGSNSSYQYKIGEPWDNEALIAEEDFSILKSDEEKAREQDSLKQFYETYFLLNVDAMKQQLDSLEKDFNASPIRGMSFYRMYLSHFKLKIQHIYATGILSREITDSLSKQESKPEKVVIYYQKESRPRNYSNLYTEKTAYEYLVRETGRDSILYDHSRMHGIDLRRYVKPNLTYDKQKSEDQHRDVDKRYVESKGIVLKGQKIVDKGQIVDKEVISVLNSWEKLQKEQTLSTKEKLSLFGWRTVYITILVLLLLIYFQQFRSDYMDSLRTMLLVMTHALVFPIITYLLVASEWTDVYIVPYIVLPIMLRISLDSRTAFVTHIITVLACAIVVTHPFTFVVTQTVAGLVAIYSLRELTQRYELFRTAVLVTLMAMLTYLCLEFIKGGPGNYQLSTEHFQFTPYINLMMAGVLSMLAYLLLIPIERIFGFTSIVTLVELQNINNPLLRRLSEEANGTFNHSMQVANLAAEIANKIGAKAQLVRTGALYHDIGKLKDPAYFTENQSGKNPHDGLSYEHSAQIIIQHVENGLRLADKYKLPAVVKDFIATHHGKSLTKYFYIKAKEAAPRGSVAGTTPFTYPGPKPQTLEQAILMMADSIEAASRSLSEYTEESISALVEKIVGSQVADGSFDECAITLREISEAKEVLSARLRSVYHTRIKYPEG